MFVHRYMNPEAKRMNKFKLCLHLGEFHTLKAAREYIKIEFLSLIHI